MPLAPSLQRQSSGVPKAPIGAESVSLHVVAQQKSRVRRPAFSLRRTLNADHAAVRMPQITVN
jgi:hypothetical protein